MPYVKILLLQYMSATRPNGRRNTVAAKRYEVVTQANATASIENSLPIDGSAILMEDPMKGVRKEAIVTTSKTTLLLILLSIGFSISFLESVDSSLVGQYNKFALGKSGDLLTGRVSRRLCAEHFRGLLLVR